MCVAAPRGHTPADSLARCRSAVGRKKDVAVSLDVETSMHLAHTRVGIDEPIGKGVDIFRGIDWHDAMGKARHGDRKHDETPPGEIEPVGAPPGRR